MHLSFIYEFLMLHFNVSQLSVWQGDWTLVVKVGDPDLNLVSSNDVAVLMWANDFILQCLRFLFSKMQLVGLSDYYEDSMKSYVKNAWHDAWMPGVF